jgi:hypothetical protein
MRALRTAKWLQSRMPYSNFKGRNMALRIDLAASVIGATIQEATGKVTGNEPNTRQETFDFFLTLADGRIVLLEPGSLSICDAIPKGSVSAKLQVIDGPSSLAGEAITDILLGDGPDFANSYTNLDASQQRQLALVLSSGRAVMNVFKCGGGNVLHTESLSGIQDNFGGSWSSAITNEHAEPTQLRR